MNTARRRPQWINRHQFNHLMLLAWEYDRGMRTEWPDGIEGLVVTEQTDKRGVTYIAATLQGCVTAHGMTRDQALLNLDVAARGYTERLVRVPLSQSNRAQLAIMQQYLAAREAELGCPCYPEGGGCPCSEDSRIAH